MTTSGVGGILGAARGNVNRYSCARRRASRDSHRPRGLTRLRACLACATTDAAMEAIVLKAVARELARELPARVQAVQQPSPREIVLLLRGAAERRLLLSTDPRPRACTWSSGRPAVLPSPTAFCRLLRKRLEGRVLVARREPRGRARRHARVRGAARRRGADLLLVAELMGKHSNLILVEAATGPGRRLAPARRAADEPGAHGAARGCPTRRRRPRAGSALDALDAPAFSALWRETGGEPGGALPARARPRARDARARRSAARAPAPGVRRRPGRRRARRAARMRGAGRAAATSGRSSTPSAACCSRCPSPGGRPSPTSRRRR